ncbi:GtrA family protein [Arcanobacterium haemolyticum]|nr:GtrA family protein [Arcanobacterium haemolyticum]
MSNHAETAATPAGGTNADTSSGSNVGGIRRWINEHPNIWEFILFNVLSNISTITRFVVAWIGTAVFVSAMGMTSPFKFLIFDYSSANSNGIGGFLTFLIAEVLAQIVNFLVQMKWVFKSDSSFKDAAWKYAILAVIIVVVNLILPGRVTELCTNWGMNAGVASTIASAVNTMLAVIVSYPLLKFWIMPKNSKKKGEAAAADAAADEAV